MNQRVLAKGYRFGDMLHWRRSIVQKNVSNLHLHCVGSSGAGKTRFLYYLCRQEIDEALRNPGRQSVVLIDPHGDLFRNVLNYAARRAETDSLGDRIVVIEPVDQRRGAIGINVLETIPGIHPYEVTDEIVSACKSIWTDAWGARMEDILRHSCLLLQEHNLTLAQMPRLLTDNDFRRLLVEQSTNRDIKLYWHSFEDFRGNDQRLFVESTRNKISAFMSNPYIKPILSQQKSTLDFHEAMNSGKIILINLSRSHLKTESRRLFGILLFSKIHQAIISRDDIPESRRTPTTIFIDECHEIFHPDFFLSILEGGRKYKAVLNLFHQSLSQMGQDAVDIILTNCGTLVCFNVGRLDAERMAKEMFSFSGKEIKYQDGDFLSGKKSKPTYFSVQEEIENAISELMSQWVGECFIKVKSKDKAPFIANTAKVEYPEASVELEEKLREASAKNYNRPLADIYQDLELMEAEFSDPADRKDEPASFRE